MVRKKGVKSSESKLTSLRYTFLIVLALAILILPIINVGQGLDNFSMTGNGILDTLFGNDDESTSGFGNFFKQLFGAPVENGKANPDLMVSKYLLFFILAVFLKSVMAVANFPPTTSKSSDGQANSSQTYQWLMAIPVALLAITFITPADLYGVLGTYSALGMALSVFIPFAILIFYTAGSLTNKENITVQSILASRFLWFLFAGFMIYRMAILWFVEKAMLSSAVMIISIAAGVIAALVTFKFSWVSKQIVEVAGMAADVKKELVKKDAQADAEISGAKLQADAFLANQVELAQQESQSVKSVAAEVFNKDATAERIKKANKLRPGSEK